MSKGNPQVEEGYTKIANELLDALMSAKLNGSEFKIVLAIIRLTYGFHKTETRITLPALEKATGISRDNIPRIINDLKSRKIVYRNGSETRLNKHYLEWGSVKSDTVKSDTVKNDGKRSVKFEGERSVKSDTAAYPYYSKEKNKKNIKKAASPNFEEDKTADMTAEQIEKYKALLAEGVREVEARLMAKGYEVIQTRDTLDF